MIFSSLFNFFVFPFPLAQFLYLGVLIFGGMGFYYCLLLFWCLVHFTLGITENVQNHAEDQDLPSSFVRSGMVRTQTELAGRLDTVSKQMKLRGSNIEASELTAALSELRDIAGSHIDDMQLLKDGLESGNLHPELLGLADLSNDLNGFPRAQGLGNEADPSVNTEGITVDPLQFDEEIKSQIVRAIDPDFPDYAIRASQEVIKQINLVSSSGRRLGAAESGAAGSRGEYMIPPGGTLPYRNGFMQSSRSEIHSIIGNALMENMSEESRERHQAKRQLTMNHLQSQNGMCHPECDPNDALCNAGKLLECMKNLSPYDFAVLTTQGFIVTAPDNEKFGSFTVNETKNGVGVYPDLDLFAADQNIMDTYSRMLTSGIYFHVDNGNCPAGEWSDNGHLESKFRSDCFCGGMEVSEKECLVAGNNLDINGPDYIAQEDLFYGEEQCGCTYDDNRDTGTKIGFGRPPCSNTGVGGTKARICKIKVSFSSVFPQ